MNRKKILIIEDETIIALNISTILASKGYEISGKGTTAEEAVILADRNRPDLILMDIVLSGAKDGVSAIEEIKKRYDVPVVYITAHSDEKTLERAKKTGPHGYILKPIKIEELLTSVEIALHKHEMETKVKESEAKYRHLFESMAEGVVYMDTEGIIISANPAAERILGVSKDRIREWNSMAPHWRTIHEDGSVFPGEDHPSMTALKTGKPVENVVMGVFHPEEDRYRWININAVPLFKDNEEKPHQVYATFRDITEGRLAQENLNMAGQNLREAQKIAGVGSWEWDAKTDTVTWSEELFHLLKRDVNRPAPTYAEHSAIYSPESFERLNHAVQEAMKTGSPYELDIEMICEDGSRKWLLARGEAVSGPAGAIEGLRGTVLNITDRKKLDEDLKMTYERILLSQEAAGAGSWDWDITHNSVEWSPKMFELFGLDPARETASFDLWKKTLHPSDREAVENNIQLALEKNIPIKNEYRVIHGNGETRWISTLGKVMHDSQGRPARIIGICIDITDQKKIEMDLLEAYKLNEQIINGVQEGIIVYGSDLRYQVWNQYMERISGKSAREVLGKHPEKVFPFLVNSGVMERLRIALQGETLPSINFKYQLPDTGKTGWSSDLSSPLKNTRGEIIGVIGLVREITESKKAEDEIKSSLKEKEVMLREIHHRVKNNMQVISSILTLQSMEIKDEDQKAPFRECINRIMSMAIVHENLYQSGNLALINFSGYLSKLMAELFDFNSQHPDNVGYTLRCGDIFLDIDKAIPCGLIVTELFTNALKHAFPAMKGGEIQLELRKEHGGFYSLIMTDNGVGMPGNYDVKNPSTLGMNLVDALVKQLRGEMEITSTRGTSVKITFPE